MTATSAAVPAVPSRPSAVIGSAAARNRDQPTVMPPSKRMTMSDDGDPLDGQDGDVVPVERGEELGGEGGGDEEDDRCGDRKTLAQLAPEDRRCEAEGDDEDDQPEVGDLVHPRTARQLRIGR